ncbi:MAG: PAS domain S-box protein [Balneolaceae bacterium]|nr:PAS domain S-box protein [Balneolaceae bacterium]
MEQQLRDQLKKLSKDEDAFKQLKDQVKKILDQRDTYKKRLHLLEAAIRSDYDSILITELELEKPGPKIVYVNDGFKEMTGYDRDEVIGKTPRILQGPKTDRETLDKLKNRLKQGKSFFGQAVNYKKDGTEFINQWDIHPLTDEEGNITHWVSYQHDITKRKKAEERIVDTEVDFDDLKEESTRTVVDVDFEGNIAMANKSFREMTGYSKGELKKKKIWDLFPKKYRDSLESRFKTDINKENFDNQNFRGILKHKTGIPIQVESRTKLMELQDRDLIRAEIKNISLQKKVMETLRKRNRDYSNIIRKASEFAYQVIIEEDEPQVSYVSEEFPEFTGYSEIEITEEAGLKEFIHPEDLEKAKKHYQKAAGGKSSTCEYRLKTSETDYVEVIDYAKPGDAGTVDGVVSLKKAHEPTKG